jgi:SAM-dependent methyltransferase
MSVPICRICGGASTRIGDKPGKFIDQVFEIFRCPSCGFAFVGNPWTDFEKIYSQEYYEGHGADPLVDYVFELEHSDRTIRNYEWHGLVKVITSLLRKERAFRWLDYGCGNGGLVRFVRQSGGIEIFGFDEGWIANRACQSGIPLVDRGVLKAAEGSFDVVTAIEVMEHVLDPLETLHKIRKLLKPGGLFFCTTGNARKHRDHLLGWHYIIPEIHVSFFEPATLEKALNRAGFRAEYRGFVGGHTEIIQCRTLKNLRVRSRAAWQSLLPWHAMAPIIDFYVGFTHHPIGWAE